MPPLTQSFVVIDFQTADPWRDSACAVALVRVEDQQIVDQASYLIRPPRSHFQLSHIHGITWEQVRNQPTFEELWPTLQPWFEHVDKLVAHNAAFDRSVLRACCETAGLPVPNLEFVCTVKLARQQWDIFPTKLPDVCRHLNIPLTSNDALTEALACAQIMIQWQGEQSDIVEPAPKQTTGKTKKKKASTKKASRKQTATSEETTKAATVQEATSTEASSQEQVTRDVTAQEASSEQEAPSKKKASKKKASRKKASSKKKATTGQPEAPGQPESPSQPKSYGPLSDMAELEALLLQSLPAEEMGVDAQKMVDSILGVLEHSPVTRAKESANARLVEPEVTSPPRKKRKRSERQAAVMQVAEPEPVTSQAPDTADTKETQAPDIAAPPAAEPSTDASSQRATATVQESSTDRDASASRGKRRTVRKTRSRRTERSAPSLSDMVLPEQTYGPMLTDFRHTFSPSQLARFFYHDCERYLRYHATPEGQREALGVPDMAQKYNPMIMTLLERGYGWEEKCVAQYKQRAKVHIAPGEGALHERVHSAKQSLALLAELQEGEAIYQPTLLVPKEFLERYQLDPQHVDFPACRPDLLLCVRDEDGLKIRVVDMKASNELKTSHKIQAALYALILRDLLEVRGLPLDIDMEVAGIWLYDQPEPTMFPLTTSCRLLDTFLRYRLRSILTKPLDQVPWHLHYRCEWCDFFVHCRQEAMNSQDASLIPYLSAGSRQYLREAHWEESASVQSLTDLEQLLQRQDASDILEQYGSLRGREKHLQNAVTALQTQEVVTHGDCSSSFPIQENIRVVLTLQSDPLSGQIYAAGFRRFLGQDVYHDGSNSALFVADTPAQCAEVQRQFLEALHAELDILHQYNAGLDWKQQKSLQCYVFDSYERKLFFELLQNALQDATTAPVALPLLFFFQHESLLDAPKHPDAEIPYPVIVLTEAIRELVALPHPLVVRLQEALKSLPSSRFHYNYEGNDLLCFALSNALRSDAIYLAWEKEHNEAAGWIEQELEKRLLATGVVVDGLREQVKDHLVVWPPKFQWPDAMNFQHEELSRLAFITRYESLMGALKARASRSRPYLERIQDGISIPLRYLGGGSWEVLSSLDATQVDPDGGLLLRLLVPEGMAGEKAQIGYDDFHHRRAWGPPRGEVRYASLLEVDPDPQTNQIRTIKLKVRSHRSQETIEAGQEFLLHPRFTDYLSERLLTRLTQIDETETARFLTLLRAPHEFMQPISQAKAFPKQALQEAKKSGMTSSQFQAFDQLLHQSLTLVWGPPGTGKTHFLTQAIRCLLHTAAKQNKPLRIAVSAFTHAALEHLLGELHELLEATGSLDLCDIVKVGDVKTGKGQTVTSHSTEDVAAATAEVERLVLGGTVYGLYKACEKGLPACDILLVDEGSQLKLTELALAFKALLPGGRLVIAGDDLQLPPIIQGVYPNTEDGKPGLHDSVFAYLRARDNPTRPYTYQLLENWRMNTTLSRFSADTLYGPSYRPASPTIAQQHLLLRFPEETPEVMTEWAEWILDPRWPLVVCILEDTLGTTENPVEAEWVAKLTVALRHQLLDPHTGAPYPATSEGDRMFWRHGLGIVSPHHKQIRSIRRALGQFHPWQSTPFVDTVDKMQGQQAQAVIVSYGVSDVETALEEAEFIYSLNRLNVSVTRAQSKCVVCLPRPLLQSSFSLLMNDRAARGLGHMHALVSFCRQHGEHQEFSFQAPLCQQQSRITTLRCRIDPPSQKIVW